MAARETFLILSDVHYAGAAEQRRRGYEAAAIDHPVLRVLVQAYRRFVWLRDPLAHNHLLDRVLVHAPPIDACIANGDYSCDSAFVGVSDDAACQSAHECLEKMRARFAGNFHAVLGDHELGKTSLFGGRGGMRLASWQRAQTELALAPFWRLERGRYVLLGVTSSLIALPVYEPDTLAAERAEWQTLRAAHLEQIRAAFAALTSRQRVVLFCHDPTALPFLARIDAVRDKLGQLEQTFIGHLHSPSVLAKSRRLAGLPPIRFLGRSIRRMSTALHEARHWQPFQVRLCPSLTGIQLLKDGGYYTMALDPDAQAPVDYQFHRLRWWPAGF